MISCKNENCKEKIRLTVYQSKKRVYCSQKCAYGSQNWGKKSRDAQTVKMLKIKHSIKSYSIKWAINNKNLILDAKYNKIMLTIQPLLNEIEKRFEVKDIRTVTQAILGKDKGRKELLKKLKEIANAT